MSSLKKNSKPLITWISVSDFRGKPDDAGDKESVAAHEHQGSMKYQENRDRRKMPTKSREYITGT